MSLVRFEPFRGFDTLARRMNSFFDDFDKDNLVERGSFSPKVDIKEDDKQITLHAEVPGLSKEDVKVTITDENVLVIKGEKKNENREEKKDDNDNTVFLRLERSYGSFTRSFILPENIDRDSIKGKVSDGVLDITLDKKEPEKPKETLVSID